MAVPADLKYTKSHEWVKIEGKVVITATLRDKDDKIVAIKTVRDDIDDNDSEVFNAKFGLTVDEVARIATVQLEVSYLKD